MNDTNQKQYGNTFWKIADDLRGAMNADETQKLAALQTHKRGLMQQLFPMGECERRQAAK